MDKVEMEWVEKIFDYMNNFFKEAWDKNFKTARDLDIAKQIWQTGLTGLNKEEIKKGLAIARGMATNKLPPPNVIEFYHFCKGIRLPSKPKKEENFPRDSVLAKRSLDLMRNRVKGTHISS